MAGIRWGLGAQGWKDIHTLPSESRAREWGQRLMRDHLIRTPKVTLYRDAGDGWKPVETFERAVPNPQALAAAMRREAHEIEVGLSPDTFDVVHREQQVDRLRKMADRLDGSGP